MTVTGVHTKAGDEMNQPKSGNHFLLIGVSLKNISDSTRSASSMGQWILRDTDGNSYNMTILVNAGANPPDGSVIAGAPLKGTLAYEVPEKINTFTLGFQSDMVTSEPVTWDINVK